MEKIQINPEVYDYLVETKCQLEDINNICARLSNNLLAYSIKDITKSGTHIANAKAELDKAIKLMNKSINQHCK